MIKKLKIKHEKTLVSCVDFAIGTNKVKRDIMHDIGRHVVHPRFRVESDFLQAKAFCYLFRTDQEK